MGIFDPLHLLLFLVLTCLPASASLLKINSALFSSLTEQLQGPSLFWLGVPVDNAIQQYKSWQGHLHLLNLAEFQKSKPHLCVQP